MNFLSKQEITAQQLFQVADGAYLNGSPWHLKTFQAELQNEYTHYLGMIDDQGQLIGFAGGTYLDDVLDISNVAIVQAYQKQHLGELLLKTWFSTFATQTTVLLEVRAGNQGAKRLYQRLGFETYRKRQAYYNHPVEDAVLMMLQLPIKSKE